MLQLRDAVEKRNKELHTLEKRINEITDRIYKEFSRSVGVANIREYEENRLKDAQSLAEERLKLSSQLSKLKYQCVPSSLFFLIISPVIGCKHNLCITQYLHAYVLLTVYYKTN